MKFRKKTAVIDAVQFHIGGGLPDGVELHKNCGTARVRCSLDGHYIIRTLEGPHVVSDGDWIITGVKGEKYPCEPDIFDATYEPVEAEEFGHEQ